MKTRHVLSLVSSLAVLSLPCLSRAADVGDPVFPDDLKGKARAELIYQNFQRELDVDVENFDGEADLEADVFMLRLHSDVGQFATLDFDIGGLDAGEDYTLYAGVGLRYLAYDSQDWRISTFLQGHYAPDASDEGVEFDLIDADFGALISRKIVIDDQLTLMPYAGPALSIIRVDGDFNDVDLSFDAEEDSIIGLIAGLSIQMRGMNGIRLEAQLYDEVSISAAASIAF